MARSFSEKEKGSIREKLVLECEKSWSAFGYKKTNIDELCTRVGISKGAFYLFFDSKEALFCEVLDEIQGRLIVLVEGTISNAPNKMDICKMLKQIYLEYDKTNILAQRNSPDFISFLNRAPEEWKKKSQVMNDGFIMNTIFSANLKLKMKKEKAIGVFNALFAILTNKDTLGYNHFEVFCVLLDSVISEIYE
ncbi:MAG: hypothetical protein PWQ08_331 [Clostridiales bacterium]|nr:hypothetical protein [Clostridiales bacterium]